MPGFCVHARNGGGAKNPQPCGGGFGVAAGGRRLCALDLASLHALGAHIGLLDLAVQLNGDLLYVRAEHTVGHAMRVADVASCNGAFPQISQTFDILITPDDIISAPTAVGRSSLYDKSPRTIPHARAMSNPVFGARGAKFIVSSNLMRCGISLQGERSALPWWT